MATPDCLVPCHLRILPPPLAVLTTATFHSRAIIILLPQAMARRRILITAADTLIGSRTLNQLLAYDVSVRAIVSSQEQVIFLRQQYPSTRYPWLEIAIVPRSRLLTPGAFDDAFRDHSEPFDTIIHTVVDQSEEADCLARFVNLQTECLLNVLRSINMINVRVHRVVVVTSLSPFARWLVDEPSPYNPYNSAPSRPSEVDNDYILATSQASDNIVYTNLWGWMREARARFELVYITTPSVYGPQMRHLETSTDLQEANRRVWNICGNVSHDRTRAPPYGIEHYADVRVSPVFLLDEVKLGGFEHLLYFRILLLQVFRPLLYLKLGTEGS